MACRLFNRSAVIRFFLLFLFLVPAGHPSPAFSDTAEAWYETGFERVLEGKTRQAESAFFRALELKPGWAEAHHQLGVLYFQSQRGPAAIFHLRQAEQAYKGRNDPQARRNLPVVRRNLEKAYRRFGLKPEDFDVAEFEPAPAAEAWSPRGAGFLLGRGGFLLAPLHTVREARKIRVRFAGGDTRPAERVRPFIIYDLAVLRLLQAPPEGTEGAILSRASLLREGETLYARAPADGPGDSPGILSGPLLEFNAVEQGRQIMQVGLPVEDLQTGAPLFNARGRVVGMLFSPHRIQTLFEYFKKAPPGAGFALKSDYLLRILPQVAGIGRKALGQASAKRSKASGELSKEALSRKIQNVQVQIETQP